MKNVSSLIFVVLVVVVLGFYMFTFQVRETEIALVTLFGDPVRTLDKPGLYLKWPTPINHVYKFDSRSYLYESVMEETNTRGGEPIIVTSYVIWSISDPLKYLESVQDKDGAEKQLFSLLRNSQNTVIGQHYFSEFVNSNPEKIQFSSIEEQMLDSIEGPAEEEYGINVRTVGIKQLGVSEKVTQEVFARMKADRQRKTEAILAQGSSQATAIRTEAESKKTEILAIAETHAQSIRGAGDAEAASYYKLLQEDPDFALFLRNIEALKTILSEKSTVVIDAETEPMELLKKVPDIKPRN